MACLCPSNYAETSRSTATFCDYSTSCYTNGNKLGKFNAITVNCWNRTSGDTTTAHCTESLGTCC